MGNAEHVIIPVAKQRVSISVHARGQGKTARSGKRSGFRRIHAIRLADGCLEDGAAGGIGRAATGR